MIIKVGSIDFNEKSDLSRLWGVKYLQIDLIPLSSLVM